LPVTPVTDSTVGIVATSFTYQLSTTDFNSGGGTVTVYAIVDGYYESSSISDPITIEVARPGSDFVTGGGWLQNTSNTKGTLAATQGKTNFGFNMQYTKSGSNLKGQCNIIVRGNGKVYQIKSNAINTLVVYQTNTVTGATEAYFNTKANYSDITDPLNVIPGPGNLDLTVKMNDVSQGGSGDQVSIYLLKPGSSSTPSELLFASNWNGTQPVLQTLGGGNVAVRSAVTTGASPIVRNIPLETTSDLKIGLTVAPNPTQNYSNIKLESSNTREPIVVRVTDQFGRTIEVKKGLSAGQTIQLGAGYKVGMYFVELIQGEERRQVKLIKQ
jgi:hypothetical protein